MSVHSFVAHFLQENGYQKTLSAFEAEHGNLIATELPHEETLEGIISDRLRYLSLDGPSKPKFEEILDPQLQDIRKRQFKPWRAPYPKTPRELGPVKELVVDSAVLSRNGILYALLATSSKSLVVVDLAKKKEVSRVPSVIGNVVIRRIVVAGELVFLCGMNGQVSVGKISENLAKFDVLSHTQIHPRLVTDIKVISWRGNLHLVSLGWDFLVKVFVLNTSDNYTLTPVGDPYKLANQGSCIDTVVYKDKLYVLVCKRELTLMDVLCMEGDHPNLYLDCRMALNDAEFSASGFTPQCVKIFTQEDGAVPLVAIGTSHEPHMRVIVVSMNGVGQKDGQAVLRHQILCNLNTSSPQDKFSDAEISWRYDGSGIWVIGDDGAIRGLDLVSGSVDVHLEGHDGRIKCVSFYEDRVVSCGTDRKVLAWE
ncbi:hypothetical protein JCM33374_g3288 [Metschnikowia sp. JCM 33374]|nr:hypothetical protein JCM33374_g3288 [Metschnikowia sp. JCM 33374]